MSRLNRAIDERLEAIHKLAAQGPTANEELIHEIRLATKQLRAFLRLLKSTKARRFRASTDRRLGEIASSLSQSRDALVIRKKLEARARKAGSRQAAAIRHILDRSGLESKAAEVPWEIVVRSTCALTLVSNRMKRRLQQGGVGRDFMEALRKEYRLVREINEDAPHIPEAALWHKWRKHVKALHYQLAPLIEVWPGQIGRLCRKTWRLQALLGDHHDLHMTLAFVAALKLSPASEPSRRHALRNIQGQIRTTEIKVKEEAHNLFRRKPKEFAAELQKRLGSGYRTM